jgi:hypothetical protein
MVNLLFRDLLQPLFPAPLVLVRFMLASDFFELVGLIADIAEQ